MKRFIFYIIFYPSFIFSQEAIIHVPEVDLIENRLDLHKIGAEQFLIR